MNVRHSILATLVLLLSGLNPLCTIGKAESADYREERWIVENFTDVLSGGPATGPAAQARGEVDALCGLSDGSVVIAGNQFIDIVTPNQLRFHLAGTGIPGFRDGAASEASFRMGMGAYYGLYNIACHDERGIFISDGGNRRVRRLYRDAKADGRWVVESYVGGGSRTLQPGESAAPLQIKLPDTMAVTTLPSGELLIGLHNGYLRVDAKGEQIRFESIWPEELDTRGKASPYLNVIAADADRKGHAYFLSRSPDVVIAVDDTGKARHLAGIVRGGPPKPHHIGDGPPYSVFLDAPTSLAANPQGAAVYVCGGDEYDIRRIPTAQDEETATLMQNGKWYRASVHPNRSRGPAAFTPTSKGRLKPDGQLSILVVAPLVGRDAQGNLYGKLNVWSGMTQYVVGEGLLSTRVFRIRRLVN